LKLGVFNAAEKGLPSSAKLIDALIKSLSLSVMSMYLRGSGNFSSRFLRSLPSDGKSGNFKFSW